MSNGKWAPSMAEAARRLSVDAAEIEEIRPDDDGGATCYDAATVVMRARGRRGRYAYSLSYHGRTNTDGTVIDDYNWSRLAPYNDSGGGAPFSVDITEEQRGAMRAEALGRGLPKRDATQLANAITSAGYATLDDWRADGYPKVPKIGSGILSKLAAASSATDEANRLRTELRDLKSAVSTLLADVEQADLPPGRGPMLLAVRALLSEGP